MPSFGSFLAFLAIVWLFSALTRRGGRGHHGGGGHGGWGRGWGHGGGWGGWGHGGGHGGWGGWGRGLGRRSRQREEREFHDPTPNDPFGYDDMRPPDLEVDAQGRRLNRRTSPSRRAVRDLDDQETPPTPEPPPPRRRGGC